MKKSISHISFIVFIALLMVLGSTPYGGSNVVKISNGTTTVDVNDDGQMHVVMEGKVDVNNSTSTTLGIDEVFTGTATETLAFSVINIATYSDVASATDGLAVEFSTDGTNWDHSDNYTVPATSGKTYSFQPVARYFRVIYTNGGVGQATFRLQTTLKKTYIKPSSHRIQDSIIDDDDAELVKAVLTGKNPADTFVNFQATTAGNFKMSLEELETGISSNTKSQLNVTPFHADGTEGALITGIDYVATKSGIDASTESLQTIEYEHHEIHDGSHYYICDFQSLANAAVVDFTVITPDTAERIHMIFQIEGTGAVSLTIREGAVVDAAGSAVSTFNNRRDSINTSNITARVGDTYTSEGAIVFRSYSGANKESGVIGRSREIILDQDSTYIFRITNETALANIVSYCSEWYEHADKN